MVAQKKSLMYYGKSNNLSTKKLFDAVKNNDVFTVQNLLQEGVDIEAKDLNGRTPLVLASSFCFKEIVELLIKAEANVDVKCNNNDCTVLHFTSRHGWTKIVRYLVNKVSDLNARDIRGETPMHYASKSGRLRIVKCLIKLADLNPKNLEGFTPLICAAQHSKKGVFDLLLKSGAKVDGTERLLLYYAFRNSWKKTVQSLMQRVPELNARYVMGEIDLDATSSEGHLEVVKFLVQEGTDINSVNTMVSLAALYHASHNGHLEVVKWLVKEGGNMKRVSDLNASLYNGDTALHLASSMRHLKIVECLVEEGADLNAVGCFGGSSLHLASRNGHLEIVKWFLRKGVPDLNAKDKSKDTALHIASGMKRIEIVKCLVEKGANINSRDSHGDTALHRASSGMYSGVQLEIVKYLVEKGAAINAKNHDGQTALYIASMTNNLQLMKYLIEKGAAINAKNINGQAVLYVASMNNNLEIIRYLVKNGADLNVRNKQDLTPLLSAVLFDIKDVAELLIASEADVETFNREKVLHLVSEKGWVDIVQFLIKRGCDLNAKNNEGKTPLNVACFSQQFHTAQALLQAGARWDTEDSNGFSPLNYIIIQKEPKIKLIKLFLEYGAYLKETDYDAIIKSSSLTIVQDAKLCCQAIINRFNNHDLPELYKIYKSKSLPPIKKMKIRGHSKEATAIEQAVQSEIQTKGYCNIFEVSLVALRLISVKSVLKYYKKSTLESKIALKRPSAFDSVNNSCKSMRLS